MNRSQSVCSFIGLTFLFAGVLSANSAELPSVTQLQTYGTNSGHGNFLGVQIELRPEYFQSEATLEAAFREPLRVAQTQGWISPEGKTVVILPELHGLFLTLLGETDPKLFDVAAFANQDDALTFLIKKNWLKILTTSSPEPIWHVKDALTRRLFNVKAKAMASAYQTAFSRLAREFNLTLVAGSLVLPGPQVDAHGTLQIDLQSPVRNVLGVFHNDGSLDSNLIEKIYPPEDEYTGLHVARAEPEHLQAFSTPVGHIGVVICADSWFPQTYARFSQLGVDYIAISSHDASKKTMSAPWAGYSLSPGFTAPLDVDPLDQGRLTEGQAWLKYAMPGRIGSVPSVLAGMTVFTHTRMWGESVIASDAPLVWSREQGLLTQGFQTAEPELINFFLPGR